MHLAQSEGFDVGSLFGVAGFIIAFIGMLCATAKRGNRRKVVLLSVFSLVFLCLQYGCVHFDEQLQLGTSGSVRPAVQPEYHAVLIALAVWALWAFFLFAASKRNP